jgi:hypothetical protein
MLSECYVSVFNVTELSAAKINHVAYLPFIKHSEVRY